MKNEPKKPGAHSPDHKSSYTKSLLKDVLAMSKNKFTRYLKQIEPELLELFPKYNKRENILPPKIFFWICDDYGMERDTVEARIIDHLGIDPPSDMEKFRRCYGITSGKTNNFMLNTPQYPPM